MKRSFRCLLMMVAIAGLCLICPIFFSQMIQDTITPIGSTLIDVGQVYTQNLFLVHAGAIGLMFIINLIFFLVLNRKVERNKTSTFVFQNIMNIAIWVAGGIVLYLSQLQSTGMVLTNAVVAADWKMFLPIILYIAAGPVQFVVDLFITTPNNRIGCISLR